MTLNCRILLLACGLVLAALPAYGQVIGADNRPMFSHHPQDDQPKGFKEGVEKMRIEKEKRDHEEMIGRAAELLKLTEDLQTSFASQHTLGGDDLDKVSKVEKLAKKIRDELGGDGDDIDADDGDDTPFPNTAEAAVEALRSSSDSLYEQLKLSTRFTISASSIAATNNVMRLARFLKQRH